MAGAGFAIGGGNMLDAGGAIWVAGGGDTSLDAVLVPLLPWCP